MIIKKLKVFLIVGGMTVVVDYMIYSSFVLTGVWDTGVSKALGFAGGSAFAYVVNRFWTFSDRSHRAASWVEFAALYVLTLLINVYINDSMLDLTNDFDYSIQVAFVLATSVSAALNFLGMNYFVFRTGRDRRIE